MPGLRLFHKSVRQCFLRFRTWFLHNAASVTLGKHWQPGFTCYIFTTCSVGGSSVGRAQRSQRWSHVAFLPPKNFKATKPKSSLYPKELETIGDHLRTRRLDLHLSQSDVAKLIRVCTDTIMKWELNQTEPAEDYYSTIKKFLGYPIDSRFWVLIFGIPHKLQLLDFKPLTIRLVLMHIHDLSVGR